MFQTFADAPAVGVTVDAATGRPCQIHSAGERLTITALEAVRDETAAYPAGWGPRTVFVVRAGERRYRLVHQIRARRWTLEPLAETGSGLASAA